MLSLMTQEIVIFACPKRCSSHQSTHLTSAYKGAGKVPIFDILPEHLVLSQGFWACQTGLSSMLTS